MYDLRLKRIIKFLYIQLLCHFDWTNLCTQKFGNGEISCTFIISDLSVHKFPSTEIYLVEMTQLKNFKELRECLLKKMFRKMSKIIIIALRY